tara:strand:+ start:2957 stop:3124 length:168 start_codon:yes stop_codon:yes gene_type:complete
MSNEIKICKECRGVGSVFFQNASGEYDCEHCLSCLEQEVEDMQKEYEYGIEVGDE